MVFPGIQGGPLMHVIAAKAIAFKEALQPEFKIYQTQVLKNARKMAEIMMMRGVEIISKGTKNHLVLLDLTSEDMTGLDLQTALGRVNITVNKNSIPNESRSPLLTSGVRIGTPAITTRGFKEKECIKIAHWICDIIDNIGDELKEKEIKEKVIDLCYKFPIYTFKL